MRLFGFCRRRFVYSSPSLLNFRLTILCVIHILAFTANAVLPVAWRGFVRLFGFCRRRFVYGPGFRDDSDDGAIPMGRSDPRGFSTVMGTHKIRASAEAYTRSARRLKPTQNRIIHKIRASAKAGKKKLPASYTSLANGEVSRVHKPESPRTERVHKCTSERRGFSIAHSQKSVYGLACRPENSEEEGAIGSAASGSKRGPAKKGSKLKRVFFGTLYGAVTLLNQIFNVASAYYGHTYYLQSLEMLSPFLIALAARVFLSQAEEKREFPPLFWPALTIASLSCLLIVFATPIVGFFQQVVDDASGVHHDASGVFSDPAMLLRRSSMARSLKTDNVAADIISTISERRLADRGDDISSDVFGLQRSSSNAPALSVFSDPAESSGPDGRITLNVSGQRRTAAVSGDAPALVESSGPDGGSSNGGEDSSIRPVGTAVSSRSDGADRTSLRDDILGLCLRFISMQFLVARRILMKSTQRQGLTLQDLGFYHYVVTIATTLFITCVIQDFHENWDRYFRETLTIYDWLLILPTVIN